MTGKDLMPDPVKVELGGKRRELVFDLSAMAYLEEEYGDIAEVATALQKKEGNFGHIRKVVFALLQHEEVEPEHTIKGVSRWINMANFPEVAAAATKAILNGLPAASAAAAKEALEKLAQGDDVKNLLRDLQSPQSTGDSSTIRPALSTDSQKESSGDPPCDKSQP